MTEQSTIQNHGATMMEITAWTVAGIGAAIWVIAGFVLMGDSDSIRPDVAGPIAWMSVGQWVAGVAVVPAILLSGIRALLPDNRIG